MPISQGRLITCLILSAISANTWADTVLVNTTADITADDASCSIREAVSYINSKIIKKATIDAEIAIIAGSSFTFALDTALVTDALTAEKAKATPDAAEIVRLEGLLKNIQDKYNASLVALNTELQTQENELVLEKGKIEPNAVKIQLCNDNIDTRKPKIKTQQDAKTSREKKQQDYRRPTINRCKSLTRDDAEVM